MNKAFKWILAGVLFAVGVAAATGAIQKADRFIGNVFQFTPGTIPFSCVAGETRYSSTDNRLKVCGPASTFVDAIPRVVAVTVNCVASPTINSNSGTVLANSISRNATGDCTLSFPVFNSIPACVCSVYGGALNKFCLNNPGGTTSSFRMLGSLDNGGVTDGQWSIICAGF